MLFHALFFNECISKTCLHAPVWTHQRTCSLTYWSNREQYNYKVNYDYIWKCYIKADIPAWYPRLRVTLDYAFSKHSTLPCILFPSKLWRRAKRVSSEALCHQRHQPAPPPAVQLNIRQSQRSGPILLIFPYYTLSVINCSALTEITLFLPPCSLPISHLLRHSCQCTELSSHLKQPSSKANQSAAKKKNPKQCSHSSCQILDSFCCHQRVKMDKTYPWASAVLFQYVLVRMLSLLSQT